MWVFHVIRKHYHSSDKKFLHNQHFFHNIGEYKRLVNPVTFTYP